MKYKLIGNNDKENIIEQVLLNRGIKDPDEYLNLDESCCNDYNNLDNINTAVECFIEHFEKRDDIAILVDSDPDGFTSAASLYNYIKRMDEDYPVHYIIHKNNKAHGLAKINDDVIIPNEVKLLIIPDAGTNDTKECNTLINNNIDVCILDHHEAEEVAKDNKAIIINNQTSSTYTDKSFSGVGIVYEFLRALDDYFICDYADYYLDLVAFGNISDVMDIRDSQTRYYIETGMNNINNKFLKALDKAQEFSTKGEVSIHNISWYWTPILNSVIRIGTFEDRDMIFRAFIETDEIFPYKKRGSDVEVDEDIYTRAARFCKNYKSKQDKMRDKLFEELLSVVNPDDKVAVVVAQNADSGIVGLSCMKLCDAISKPTIVLCEHEKGVLGGSCRNYNGSPVKDFKSVVNSVGLFTFAQGHSNAFGTEITIDKLDEAIEALNKSLENIEYDDTIDVDFILDIYDFDAEFITTIDKAKWLWGQGIEEPELAIEGIEVCSDDISVMGKDNNVVSFFVDGVKYCKFKLPEDDKLLQFALDCEDKTITLNIVGKCSINEYGGNRTAQVIIDDYEFMT